MTRFDPSAAPRLARPFFVLPAAALLALAACGGGAEEAPPPALPADPPAGATLEGDAPEGDFERGVALVKAEKFAEAKPLFEKVHASEPKRADAAFYLALTSEKTDDREGAERAYKAALEADPGFVEAAQNLAALYLDDPARPDEAIATLGGMLERAPGDVRLLQNLAYAYALKKDVPNASKHYEAALAKGENALIRLSYAQLLLEHKERDKAGEQLKKALASTGEDAPMLATVGRLLASSGAFEECVKAFDRAIAVKKDEAEFFVRRGTCKHELKDEKGAQADYEAALKVDPQFAAAHYYLGLSLLLGKERDRGLKELEHAAELGADTAIGKAARDKLASVKKGGGAKRK